MRATSEKLQLKLLGIRTAYYTMLDLMAARQCEVKDRDPGVEMSSTKDTPCFVDAMSLRHCLVKSCIMKCAWKEACNMYADARTEAVLGQRQNPTI